MEISEYSGGEYDNVADNWLEISQSEETFDLKLSESSDWIADDPNKKRDDMNKEGRASSREPNHPATSIVSRPVCQEESNPTQI